MIDGIGDIVTGINLVRQSVDFIKSTINTAKDVNDIVGAIDDLLDGEQQINAKRSKKDGVSLKDQLGIKSVAHEVIDAKIAAEQRYEMSILIDQRFGHGTFKSIVDLRAKRIQEAKERAKEEAKARKAKQEEIMEAVAIGIGILLVVGLAATVFGALLLNAMERGSPSFNEWMNEWMYLIIEGYTERSWTSVRGFILITSIIIAVYKERQELNPCISKLVDVGFSSMSLSASLTTL